MLKTFIENTTKQVQVLYKSWADAHWNASITWKPEDYASSEQYELAFNEYLSDNKKIIELQQLAKEETNRNTILKREYDIIYRLFLGYQGDQELLKKMISLSTQIQQKFSTYRATYNNQEYTDNDVEGILKNSKDSEELQGIREAHKAIGPQVNEDIIELVHLRNQHAQSLWFKNYLTMSLFLGEQDEGEIDQIFDELAIKIKPVFTQHKGLLDQHLADRYGCAIEELKPRHYQNRYFQEVPSSRWSVNLSEYYQDKNIETLTNDFYTSIGIDISDIIKTSDLYEKPGKNQHAYCLNDKTWMVRVLCNIKPNEKWMGTMLHEFWHAAYDKYIDQNLPYLLSDPAHTFTTEAVAQFFQELSVNGEWMQEILNITDEQKNKIQTSSEYLIAFDKIIFAQRAQVIRRFEKELYANPEQDLNKLWRDLVSEYQGLTPPAGRNSPDRATKIHIATSPCYYHNYLLGYILSQQRRGKIQDISSENMSLVGAKQVGKRFIDTVFSPWASITWRELVRNSTGQDLSPDIFVQSIQKKLS